MNIWELTEPIWLIFISDIYKTVGTICANFHEDIVLNVISVQNMYLNRGRVYIEATRIHGQADRQQYIESDSDSKLFGIINNKSISPSLRRCNECTKV